MSGPVNARSVYDMNALRGGAVVKRRLGASPDGVDYVIVGLYLPQLRVEVGEPLSKRTLYRVQSGHDGRLVEHRRGAHPGPSASAAAGPAAAEQAEGRSLPDSRAAVLDSYRAARAPPASRRACRAFDAALSRPRAASVWPGGRACVQHLLTGIADQLAAQRRILKADMRQRRTNRAFSLARVCGHFEVPVIRQ